MARTLLIKNGIIITLGDENKVLYGHALLCQDGLIKKIGPQAEFRGRYSKVIDAKGKAVLPGFINAHMHFYSTMARGLGKAAPSRDFQEVLEHLWWRLDKKLTLEDSYYSALLPLIDAVKRGTTTLIDHHASPFAARGSLEKIAQAVKVSGLRASLCYELSDRDGAKVAQDGMDENVAFLKQCAKERDPQLKGLFGLHASFTIQDSTMARAAEAGHELGAGFHVHAAEAKSDQDYNVKHFGMRVVPRLNKFGILGPKTIAAHCVHVDDDEMNMLRDTGTAVAHNPQSNMNNAVGVADIIKMSQKGILVGLGTDAMTVNMLEEVRAALWAQRLSRNNPGAGFVEALSTLMFNNARIANRYWDPKVGVLQEGFAADIVLMDYYPPTPLNEDTFLGHLGFGLSQSFVDTTVCNGKVLMEGKKLKIGVDEAEVAAKSLELAEKLWARF
ncbi:MAG TPA: putative aminohydrolase SsnA [Elusimicrobia bacterium]|nr:putative aminohydrolase SsnA [Elusimicrobiota bacterium]HBT62042.1 putative aminohydrolase SsnA [Elusimicrobiota bacterium]